jgi:proteasome lid subunit RPN8/RPN11
MNTWFGRKSPAPLDVTVTVRVSPSRRRAKGVTRTSPPNIIIPTDLLMSAWRQLFPAERMVVFGGRADGDDVLVTSYVDVTEPNPSAVHVRACPQKLAQALIDFERTSAHLSLWMHSHPGEGARATHPSRIDRDQEESLRHHYSQRLVSLIAVRDGYVRVWGQAPAQGVVAVRFNGSGLETDPEEQHVYRLALA